MSKRLSKSDKDNSNSNPPKKKCDIWKKNENTDTPLTPPVTTTNESTINDYNANLESKRSKYYMTLTDDVKDRYDNKIIECGGIDPYTLLPKDLSVSSTDFPDITVLDIGNYMIQSKSPYTKRAFNAYKSTEAYSFFESGFVLSVGSKKINDLVILVGRVKHSQSMNKTPLQPWVLASMNGTINCAHCNCLSGLSETCSHVAAICFAVSNIGESREKSVTDMLCKWNMPSFKDVSMSAIKEIHWKHSTKERKSHETNFVKYCNSIEHFTDERIYQFIEKCHSDGDSTALGTLIISSKMQRKTNIKDEIFLASLYNVEHKSKSLSELIEIGKSISLIVTNDEVKEISKITLNKEKSKFFVGLRRGRISGSNFKSCCVSTVENPSITTVNYMMNPRNLDNVPCINYQIKNRKKALQKYMCEAITDHENFEYNQCGLIINPRLPYFVGSPDGIVSCSCHGKGCVAIKCLKILELGGSFEVLTVKPNNILNKTGNTYVLERNHELFYQVQLQINLISLNYCDVVFWSPKDILIIRVDSNIDFWKSAMNKALTFHEQVIMPEILGKFYTKNSQTNNENKGFKLVALEIELLGSDASDVEQELEIDPLCSDEEEKMEESISSSEDSVLACGGHKADIGEETSNEIKSKKEKSEFQYVDSYFESVRNLMNLSVENILRTFDDHKDELKRLYDEHIKKPKRNYKSKDLPDMLEFDIVNKEQLQAMAVFAESKLADNADEEQNSTDVIFDAILPEWALAAFCKKYKLTRCEAIERIQLQSLIEMAKHHEI